MSQGASTVFGGEKESAVAARIIFVNGIQSAGKSTVARKLERRESGFRVLVNDELIRAVPMTERLQRHRELWAQTLDVVQRWSDSTGVIVDAALREDQIREARDRFPEALFVLLRVDEATRARRERTRRDRQLLVQFDPSWHSVPGPDSLYDLVLDAGRTDVSSMANAIRTALRQDSQERTAE